MYGTCEVGNCLEDWLNTNLIILWGHNPAETKFDCGTMYYLKKAKEKGIPIIVVDPRKMTRFFSWGRSGSPYALPRTAP